MPSSVAAHRKSIGAQSRRSRAAAAGLSANGFSLRCYGGRHGRAPSSRLLTGNRMINRKLLIVNTLLRSVTEAPRVAAAPRSTSWHIPGHSPSDLAGTARWSAAAQPARPAAPQQHRADLGGDLTGPRHDVSPAVPERDRPVDGGSIVPVGLEPLVLRRMGDGAIDFHGDQIL